MEFCNWINWQNIIPEEFSSNRVYFGHETCDKLLPDMQHIKTILKYSSPGNVQLTFVTPFQTQSGIGKTKELLLYLHDNIENFEVVLSDWGLLDWVCSNKIGIPVISRFLVGQQSDFRLPQLLSGELAADKIIFLNNVYYNLHQINPSNELKEHICSCSLLSPGIIEYFNGLGIFRFELSNVFQDIIINQEPGNVYSLHVPFVPLTIMRWCPSKKENFNSLNYNCTKETCNNRYAEWHLPDDKIEIIRIDNAIYYKNYLWKPKVLANEKINRVIFRNYFE